MARVELLVTVDKIVSSNLQPVSGASVLVKLRSTGNPVTVFAGETGGTTVSNPLTTDANGRVNGWVDEASLVLTVSGSGITTYNQPYEAVSASAILAFDGARITASSIPSAALAANAVTSTKIASGAVLGKHLAESAMPLGTILAWWQPSKPGGGFVIPTGFALCNGQSLTAGSHDFSGGGTVVLPNLISRSLIGADPALAYAAGGSALGMNGQGGANAVSLAHTHTMAHTHTIATHSHQIQSHTHGMGHSHGAFVPDHVHGIPTTKVGSSGAATLGLNGSATYGSGGVNISTDGGNRSVTDATTPSTSNQTGGTLTNASSAPDTGLAGSSSQDMRHAVQGVLFIMKVRNTV